MAPKHPRSTGRPTTYKCQGKQYRIPDIGVTPLKELIPGEFINKLKSLNPTLADIEIGRDIINNAFISLLRAEWGSIHASGAREAQKAWTRKLTDHLILDRQEQGSKPKPNPGQKVKPTIIIEGQSWFIPKAISLGGLGLRLFAEQFITVNCGRPFLHFTTNILLKAFKAFVSSQYPSASSTEIASVIHRKDGIQAGQFLRGHEARLKAAAEKLRRSPQESPKSRRPENRIASLQGATIKSRGETSDGGDADSEEDSEEDSEVDSEESGSQGGEGESSAKKKSEDSEESGDRSEDEESQDNQESEEISEEEPQVESQQGKIITADKESLCSIESSTSEDGVAEEVNHRKRRRESTSSSSDNSVCQPAKAIRPKFQSRTQDMPKPKTRHIAKRARLCHASSPASEEDYVYESSGICLTPVPPSPQRLSAVVPVDQLPEKEGFRRRSPSSRDGQYGPGRDVFSSLLDWLESVT